MWLTVWSFQLANLIIKALIWKGEWENVVRGRRYQQNITLIRIVAPRYIFVQIQKKNRAAIVPSVDFMWICNGFIIPQGNRTHYRSACEVCIWNEKEPQVQITSKLSHIHESQMNKFQMPCRWQEGPGVALGSLISWELVLWNGVQSAVSRWVIPSPVSSISMRLCDWMLLPATGSRHCAVLRIHMDVCNCLFGLN